MLCYSSKFLNTTVDSDNMHGVKFSYAFQLDNVRIDQTVTNPQDMFTVFPDPIFHEFKGNTEKSYQSKTDNYLTINVSRKCGALVTRFILPNYQTWH